MIHIAGCEPGGGSGVYPCSLIVVDVKPEGAYLWARELGIDLGRIARGQTGLARIVPIGRDLHQSHAVCIKRELPMWVHPRSPEIDFPPRYPTKLHRLHSDVTSRTVLICASPSMKGFSQDINLFSAFDAEERAHFANATEKTLPFVDAPHARSLSLADEPEKLPNTLLENVGHSDLNLGGFTSDGLKGFQRSVSKKKRT